VYTLADSIQSIKDWIDTDGLKGEARAQEDRAWSWSGKDQLSAEWRHFGRVVTIGHTLCETIVFADGRRAGPVLGSPAAYASAGAARLGVRTGIVTKVGPDAPPTNPAAKVRVSTSPA
jgi:hypothetical protein